MARYIVDSPNPNTSSTNEINTFTQHISFVFLLLQYIIFF